jgi:hypothetical protein
LPALIRILFSSAVRLRRGRRRHVSCRRSHSLRIARIEKEGTRTPVLRWKLKIDIKEIAE